VHWFVDVLIVVASFALGFFYCAWSLRRYVEKRAKYWAAFPHVHEPDSHVQPHEPPPFDQDAE